MERFNRYIAIVSLLGCLMFYVNTYLFKYLPRNIFYLLGLYMPIVLIVFVLGYFLYAKLKKRGIEKLSLLLTFFFSLIALLLYGYYMQKALMVR